jgi:hypothetical protein
MNLKSFLLTFGIILFVSLSCKNKTQAKVDIQNIQKQDSVTIDKSKLGEKEILSWTYDEALAKLGNSIACDSFTMAGVPEFRIELLRFLPADPDLVVKELTWRTDSVTNLTIWYVLKEKLWKPVHFMRWHKDKEF